MTFDDYWQQCTEGIAPNGLYTTDTVRELCRNAYLTGKDNDHLLVDAAMKVLRVHGNAALRGGEAVPLESTVMQQEAEK